MEIFLVYDWRVHAHESGPIFFNLIKQNQIKNKYKWQNRWMWFDLVKINNRMEIYGNMWYSIIIIIKIIEDLCG